MIKYFKLIRISNLMIATLAVLVATYSIKGHDLLLLLYAIISVVCTMSFGNILNDVLDLYPDKYKEIIYANQEYITEYLSEYITDYKNITDSEALKFMTAHSIESNKYENLNYDGVELINRNGNIEEVPFVKYDHQAKVARIAKGDYTLTQNLIIPPGITFIIDPGVTLYLDNSSSVISYSNMQLLGNKNSKVTIISVFS